MLNFILIVLKNYFFYVQKLDRLVPVEASRKFINEQKHKELIKLIEVVDNHYLMNSLFQIIPIVS